MERQRHPQAHAGEAVTRHAHPNYVGIFGVLFVLTAIEVGITFVPAVPQGPSLVTLMFLKAGLVVLYYMHLKLDSRVFAWLFGAGLIGAAFLMLSFLLLFSRHPGIAG